MACTKSPTWASNTHWQEQDRYLWGEVITILGMLASALKENRALRRGGAKEIHINDHVLLHVRACGDSPASGQWHTLSVIKRVDKDTDFTECGALYRWAVGLPYLYL